MDMISVTATNIKIARPFTSSLTRKMANTTSFVQPKLHSSRPEMLGPYTSGRSFCNSFPIHQRVLPPNFRSSTLSITCSFIKQGIDSNNATNQKTATELESSLAVQSVATPPTNTAVTSTRSEGLVFDLDPANSWDNAEIGSPVVKRYIGDNEERWYMWYHGESEDEDNATDSIGLAVWRNGIQSACGPVHVRPCANDGMVLSCSNKWWALDNGSIRPSEMVIMSSPVYSAVYWLYYTGYSSEEVEVPGIPNISIENPERVQKKMRTGNTQGRSVFKSLPSFACSRDGRHWARIEGDHHSGALLDVGSGKEWDSLFIAAPQVVIHSSDDLRMCYHPFDVKKEQFALGIARSRDGIRWVKLGKVMEGGLKGSSDELEVKNACVVSNRKAGNYLMSYEGVAVDGKRSIGLAVSPDGLKIWKRVQEDPILEPSEEEGWDNGVGSPCLVQMEDNIDEWRLFYAGIGPFF